MRKTVAIAAGFFALTAAFASGAETFRVRSVTPIAIDARDNSPISVGLGYNDAVGILFPKDVTFLRGVEIEMKLPGEILDNPNCMAYGLYRQIKPSISASQIDYQAEQIVLTPLPARHSFVIQIPLQKNSGLKSSPYATVVPYTHDATKGPLLIRLLPIMKGLPENIESLAFPVRVKPLFADLGGMRLSLSYPEGPVRPVSIRIDEMLVERGDELQLLPPGSHHLSIVSDDYRSEVRVFTVEQARVSEIALTLQDTTPRLYLVGPENAVVLLDAQPIALTKDPFALTPGDHVITFKVGDYELTKQLSVEKGRDYTVSVLFDLQISVSP